MRKTGRRQRRWEDDREAGLALEWRLPQGSLGRMILGVSVATALFAGAASVLHIRIPYSPMPTREAAQVVTLGEEDEVARELLDWARFHSPFPDRWDPIGSGLPEARMAEIDKALAAGCAYQPRLLPSLDRVELAPVPGLIELETFPLPPLAERPSGPVPVDLPERVDAVAGARGELRERWGEERLAWRGTDDAAMIGRKASFTVGINPGGEVVFCLALDGVGNRADERLRSWIFQKTLAPDPGAPGLTMGVVDVRFEAGLGSPEPN